MPFECRGMSFVPRSKAFASRSEAFAVGAGHSKPGARHFEFGSVLICRVVESGCNKPARKRGPNLQAACFALANPLACGTTTIPRRRRYHRHRQPSRTNTGVDIFAIRGPCFSTAQYWSEHRPYRYQPRQQCVHLANGEKRVRIVTGPKSRTSRDHLLPVLYVFCVTSLRHIFILLLRHFGQQKKLKSGRPN